MSLIIQSRPTSPNCCAHYQPSLRAYPARIPVPTYPGHFVVKKVTTGGIFRLHQKLLYIANALVDQVIGLEETDDGVWAIYFNTVLLGTLNHPGCSTA